MGDQQQVKLSGDDNLLTRVETNVDDGRLAVDVDGWLDPKLPLVLELTVLDVDGIELSGSNDVLIRDLDGERFDLRISGSADVELTGTIGQLVVDSSGSARVDARNLWASRVDIDSSGSSKIQVCADDTLVIDISGSGDVDYWCSPSTIHEDVTGSARIRER